MTASTRCRPEPPGRAGGGGTFDDGLAELGPDDSIVIDAHYRYGFTCGPDGMEFLTIRVGEASMAMSLEAGAEPETS